MRNNNRRFKEPVYVLRDESLKGTPEYGLVGTSNTDPPLRVRLVAKQPGSRNPCTGCVFRYLNQRLFWGCVSFGAILISCCALPAGLTGVWVEEKTSDNAKGGPDETH